MERRLELLAERAAAALDFVTEAAKQTNEAIGQAIKSRFQVGPPSTTLQVKLSGLEMDHCLLILPTSSFCALQAECSAVSALDKVIKKAALAGKE